jgi:hypothetical protein
LKNKTRLAARGEENKKGKKRRNSREEMLVR